LLWLLLAFALPARADNYDFGDMRLAPLADPVQLSYPAGAAPSAAKLREVVAVVAPSREWRVLSQSERRIELERNVRNKHMLRVELVSDDRGIQLRYLDSVNLMYRELERGGDRLPVIHHNYNIWTQELAAAIAGGLGIGAKPIAGFAPIESVAAVPYLRDGGRRGYADFLTRLAPRAFAIAPNGAWGFSGPVTPIYNARARERFDPIENALERCNKRGEGKCRLYAIDGRVVWRGDL
jgi:hypothetical protein